MMEQGSRGKIGLKEEKKDKGWINGRRDDEVLRKGKYILWLREGEREREVSVIHCLTLHMVCMWVCRRAAMISRLIN